MPTPAFDRAVAIVLAHEGGYQCAPADPGNWTGGHQNVGTLKGTNFGISAASYPTEDIAHLTRERAAQLYHRDFWLPLRGDDLPWALAVQLFDHGVNAGCGSAVKLLQRALGVRDDGVIGPVTLTAAAGSGRSHAVAYARRRIRYYGGLAQWDRYGDSWTQRTLETLLDAVITPQS